MSDLQPFPQPWGGTAALTNAALGAGMFAIAYGLIGSAVLADPEQLAALARVHAEPLIVQDVFKLGSATAAVVLVGAVHCRLARQSSGRAALATAFGLAAALCLFANAGLSLRALWLTTDDLRLAGVSLIDWFGLATLFLNGVWYGLVNALAWRRRAWSRGLCLLGLTAAALSFLPPLAPVLLVAGIAWSTGLGWSWLREAAQAGALAGRSDWRWRGMSWTPVVCLASYALFLSAQLSRSGLGRVHAWLDLQAMLPLLGAIALFGVLIYVGATRRLSRVLTTTGGAALLALLPAVQAFTPLVAYPASRGEMDPAVTVRAPADGPLKVLWGGESLGANYHAAYADQRWAYDLARAPYLMGSSRLEDYGCYGLPVLAPIDAVVSSTHDGEPDNVPGGASTNVAVPEGNRVVLQLETGTYVILAHLQPGSLQVAAGDDVAAGQMLGRCGNSGNSSEPHIHIHHQRQDPDVTPMNLAEGLPLYFTGPNGPWMPEGGIQMRDGQPRAVGVFIDNIPGRSPAMAP